MYMYIYVYVYVYICICIAGHLRHNRSREYMRIIIIVISAIGIHYLKTLNSLILTTLIIANKQH